MGKLQNLATPFLPIESWIGTPSYCSTQSPFFVLRRHVFQFLLFVIWLFFGSLPAQAQNISPDPIEITPEFTEKTIGLDLSILEDHNAHLTLQDIRSAEYANQFTPSKDPNPNFGYTKSAYWARFSLTILEAQSALMQICL